MSTEFGSLTLDEVSALIQKLGGNEGARRFLHNDSKDTKLNKEENLIDCGANPFCPSYWEVEEHRKDGTLVWDPKKVRLHLDDAQRGEGRIGGHDLRKALKGKPVLNANVLDHLLKHPHLIPREWKKKYVFFWGTVYRNRVGYLIVRYLYWDGDRWSWNGYWLGNEWYSVGPAVVRASI